VDGDEQPSANECDIGAFVFAPAAPTLFLPVLVASSEGPG
jgi:hypothetical protein